MRIVKLMFSTEWLRRKIASDPDLEVEVGMPLLATDEVGEQCRIERQAEKVAIIEGRNAVQLRIALGTLVRQLRLLEGLTVDELAERANVPTDELRQVEHDPHYTAHPRMLHQLSEYFNVPLQNLAQMSGATHAVDRVLYNEAVKYAAHSDDVSTLTNEEREALNKFVAMLNEHGGTRRQ